MYINGELEVDCIKLKDVVMNQTGQCNHSNTDISIIMLTSKYPWYSPWLYPYKIMM